MKITRLKIGYAMRVSDSEFEVLRALLGNILSGEIEDDGMTPAQKRVLRSDRWRSAHGTLMTVDEDRRN